MNHVLSEKMGEDIDDINKSSANKMAGASQEQQNHTQPYIHVVPNRIRSKRGLPNKIYYVYNVLFITICFLCKEIFVYEIKSLVLRFMNSQFEI